MHQASCSRPLPARPWHVCVVFVMGGGLSVSVCEWWEAEICQHALDWNVGCCRQVAQCPSPQALESRVQGVCVEVG